MMLTVERKRWARVWLCVVLALTSAAHVFFYRFSVDHLNNYPISQGLTAGCIIWSTVLWIAVMLRHAWARYMMIVMICGAIIGFSALALKIRSESVLPLPHLMQLVILGVLLYGVALLPLSMPMSLRFYLGPRTAGDR